MPAEVVELIRNHTLAEASSYLEQVNSLFPSYFGCA